MTEEFRGKRVAVVGMARTGLTSAPILKELGAEVLLSDSDSAEKLGERADLARNSGVLYKFKATPEDALEGAEVVIPSPGVPHYAEVLVLAKQRGLTILSEIEVAYRIARCSILAITGTNGKTTTTILLGEMLRQAGWKTWIAGNVSADEIKQTLIEAAWKASPEEAIVAEIGVFQLDWVEKFRPKVAMLTNITPDHLNRYGTLEEYAKTKARLFAAQTQDDYAVLNATDPATRKISKNSQAKKLWFQQNELTTGDGAYLKEGKITVRWQGEETTLCRPDELLLFGTHNLENALAASCAAIAFGAKPEPILQTLKTFSGVVHRMERVGEWNGVLYINNSMCTNVDAAVRSLEALNRPTVLIAGGVDKNGDFKLLGEAIAKGAKHLVLIGRSAPEIEKAVIEAGFHSISHAASMSEAVIKASEYAVSGDIVMLSPACASFDMFVDFEGRGEAFRQVVRSLFSQESR